MPEDRSEIAQAPPCVNSSQAEITKHDRHSQLSTVERQTEEPVVSRSRGQVFAIMTALLLSVFLGALNFTLVSTAIPTISAYFHSAAGYIWIGSSTSLATAAAGPIWGKLSDIWGRKPILLITTFIFALSSVICATAVSLPMLLVGRSLQGVGGSGLLLLVNICIADLFSVRKRGLFYGMTEVVWAVVGGVGPLMGGAFSQYVSWRWCWYILLPITGLTFVLTLLFLDVHNPRTPVAAGLRAIDWLGCLTILGFTLMLLLGLDFGGAAKPWNSATVICLIVFGSLMSFLFVFSETKIAKYPVMPFRIMRHRSNIATLTIALAHGFCFIGVEYYLPLYFQSVKQSTPLQSGLLVLPVAITEAIAGSLCGLLIHKTGHYMGMIYAGGIIQSLGIGLFILFDSDTSIAKIIGYQIVAGIGAGVLFTPPLIALHALTPQSETATATSTFSFTRNLAMCISIVAGGVVFQNSMTLRTADLHEAGIDSDIMTQLAGREAAANVKVIGQLHGTQQRAAKEAYAWSMRNVWIMYCVMAAISAIASLFIFRQELDTQHTETKTGLEEKNEHEIDPSA